MTENLDDRILEILYDHYKEYPRNVRFSIIDLYAQLAQEGYQQEIVLNRLYDLAQKGMLNYALNDGARSGTASIAALGIVTTAATRRANQLEISKDRTKTESKSQVPLRISQWGVRFLLGCLLVDVLLSSYLAWRLLSARKYIIYNIGMIVGAAGTIAVIAAIFARREGYLTRQGVSQWLWDRRRTIFGITGLFVLLSLLWLPIRCSCWPPIPTSIFTPTLKPTETLTVTQPTSLPTTLTLEMTSTTTPTQTIVPLSPTATLKLTPSPTFTNTLSPVPTHTITATQSPIRPFTPTPTTTQGPTATVAEPPKPTTLPPTSTETVCPPTATVAEPPAPTVTDPSPTATTRPPIATIADPPTRRPTALPTATLAEPPRPSSRNSSTQP